MNVDPLDALIDHAAAARRESLPSSVVEHTRRRIADNLGCAFAGARAQGTDALLAVQGRGAAGPCAVIGRTLQLPAREAAMQNSLAARAWDFCDVIAPGYHPSSTDVPAGIAVAAACGASGRDLLTALAVAQDVVCRINAAALATGRLYDGFDANVLAPLGAALVAGRLLGLPRDRLRDAVSLAANTSAGSFQAVQDKVLAVRFAQAFATRNGIEAAMLAAHGVTGPRRTLGGELSFFRLHAKREPDLAELTRDLGHAWRGPELTCFKLYPSCGVTLALTDGALALADTIEPEHVRRVLLRVSPTMMLLCGQPLDAARANEVDAMFSVRYVVANALLRRRSVPLDFTLPSIREPRVGLLAGRVEVETEPAFQGYDECEIRIECDDGRALRRHARDGRGWPANPASDAELEAKLVSSLEFGNVTDPHRASTALRASVDALEEPSGLQGLLRTIDALCPPSRRAPAPRLPRTRPGGAAERRT